MPNGPAASAPALPPAAGADEVAILMAVHQGARFLPAQLDSFAGQSHGAWRLVAADDGSTDGGPQILRDFSALHPGRVELRAGPRRGAAANFVALLRDAPDTPYAALADQDDAWQPDRLARGIAALRGIGERPALWCSRVTICDAALAPVGVSRLWTTPPSFRHALVQNMVQGNTVLLNRAAVRLLRAAAGDGGAVVMHDWWAYQIVTGAGGTVIHDPRPSVLYRQHGGNVVGANEGSAARLASLGRMLRGGHREWSLSNLSAMTASAHRLTDENRRVLAQFERLVHGAGPRERLAALAQGGFHRQGAASQASLRLAAVLGRA